MKMRFGKQIVFALLFLLAAGVAFAADPGAVTVILVQGTVEVAPAGTDNWAPATLNQTLKVGDKLRTGKLSRTALRSAAGDMPVRESSLLTIAAPKPGSDRPVYELLRGFFYYFTRGQPTDIEFRNRLASAAARGTEFTVRVDDLGNEIEITVRVASPRRRAGIRVYRRPTLADRDVTERDGIPVTDLVRTFVDLASILKPRLVERSVNEADRLDLINPSTLRLELQP